MFQRLSVKKPKLNFHEAAEDIFLKLFKEELHRTTGRIKFRLTDNHNAVSRDKLTLILSGLFVFIVEQSASDVYGDTKLRKKMLNEFHFLIREEYEEYYAFIIELAQKFGISYRKSPKEPLLELGLCFSNYIKKKNKNDIIAAMACTTETAKKLRLISNYYRQLNKEFKV